MNKKYAFEEFKENMARAMVKDAEVSSKVSIEIAKWLRGRMTDTAKAMLQRVLEKKQAVPFTRFTDGVGHRRGNKIGPGRFPKKASQEFLDLLESVEANAQSKGLSSNLKIIHLLAHKGTDQFKYGRQRRRTFKRTHLEVVVEEQEEKTKVTSKAVIKKQETEKSPVVEKKEVKQTATKPVEKVSEKKPEEKPEENPNQTAEKKEELKSQEAKSEGTETNLEKPKTEEVKK